MQKWMIKLAILSCLLASSSAWARGDGSLPLGRGDGSLPLRTTGSAVEMKDRDAPDAVEMLTKVVVSELSEEADELLLCDTDIPATIAIGKIIVGGKSFDIKALCYDAETTKITIFATRFGATGMEKAQVRGLLKEGDTRSLTGRLTIEEPNVRSTRFLIKAKEEVVETEKEAKDSVDAAAY